MGSWIGGFELLSVAQTAARTGLSVATTRRRFADGSIRAVKVGKEWITTGIHVQRYLDAKGRAHRAADRPI